jgi:hypothetical protein
MIVFIIFYDIRENLVIVSSHYKEDLAWLENSKWPVVIYSKNPESPHFRGQENVGNETTAYLLYIIQHYDNLPNYVAFIHGHEESYHQKCGNILNLIDKAKIQEFDFISLNCSELKQDINYSCEHDTRVADIHNIWDNHIKQYLKYDAPYMINTDCCAQFIVSGKAIKNNNKEMYEYFYYNFKEIFNSIPDKPHKYGGELFEFLWPLIFGQDPLGETIEERKNKFSF